MGVAENIRLARQQAGLTQHELAHDSGYSRSSISNIEADRQDLTVAGLYAIADALAVRPGDLLGEGPERGPSELMKVMRTLQRTVLMCEAAAARLRRQANSLDEQAAEVRQALQALRVSEQGKSSGPPEA